MQLALLNLDELLWDDFRHFRIRKTDVEGFERVAGRFAVSKFLLAVGHLEQVHVVGIAEAAHNRVAWCVVRVLFSVRRCTP